MKRQPLFLLISVPTVLLDQITKYLTSNYIDPFDPVDLLPFLRLVNVKNVGAAFGLFTSMGNTFFIIITLLAITLIVFLTIREKEGFVGLTLILSGAVGNLIDRAFLGYVRDFIDFHAGGYHWPAFNVADSALTIGVAILLLGSLFHKKPKLTPEA
jgi:signal peptidase II